MSRTADIQALNAEVGGMRDQVLVSQLRGAAQVDDPARLAGTWHILSGVLSDAASRIEELTKLAPGTDWPPPPRRGAA